jgi:hypothetical protein
MQRLLLHVVGFLVTAGCTPAPTPRTVSHEPPKKHEYEEVARLVRERCVSCHNANHSLNLTPLPPLDQRETWHRIANAVRSGKMPPPSAADPFPLDPAIRSRIANAIEQLESRAHPEPALVALSFEEWRSILSEVSQDLLSKDELRLIIRDHSAYPGGLLVYGDVGTGAAIEDLPLRSVSQDRISVAVCTRMLEHDAARSPTDRVILPSDPRMARRAAWLIALRHVFSRVYRSEPLKDDEEDGLATMSAAATYTTDVLAPYVALCVSYVTGPKLLFAFGRKTGG